MHETALVAITKVILTSALSVVCSLPSLAQQAITDPAKLQLTGEPTFTWNLLDLKRVKWRGADALPPGKRAAEATPVEFDNARDF